ncbi:hypothetical protein [Frigoriglobus tundricola]|uniref:DUF4398 domain-containing protein n=1 Tax=Frigoriglobus tundricola TaxID=2774151 RepID=A0A6M5Z356_9BACT|nr:hypothetical protein [Frigoriglobus tundricola]QJW99871.1 hypothetical protein FTUN_7494 [Frigoriglobus tundricola]
MRITTGRLVAPALFLATAVLVIGAGGAVGQPAKDKEPGKEKKDKDKDKDKGPKDGPKGGPQKGAKEIRKAFDGITEAAQSAPAGKEANRLLDHAKAFYRAAVKAYPDEPRRFRELAVAANDAVRGLEHLRRAAYQPVLGLPEPPAEFDGPRGKGAPPPPKDGPKGREARTDATERGPWTPALDALTDVQEQLAAVAPPTKGAAKDFFEAARNTYRQARPAYEAGDYRKATELAHAADAWLRVIEHLDRAEWDGPAAPPPLAPEPKRGAPPLPPLKN